MESRLTSVSKLSPYEKNAKKHPAKQVAQVAASIKEFGFNQPIVIDKAGVIIVGHGRYEAAKTLGLTEVPTITVDLTEEQAKERLESPSNLVNRFANPEVKITELKQPGNIEKPKLPEFLRTSIAILSRGLSGNSLDNLLNFCCNSISIYPLYSCVN